MAKLRRMALSNAMLITNFLAIWTSSLISYYLTENISSNQHTQETAGAYNELLEWLYVVLVGALTIAYELPIRRGLKMVLKKNPVDTQVLHFAQRRLLNEPYAVMAINFSVWIILGLFFIAHLILAGIDPYLAFLEGVDTLLTAIITVTTAFFLLQFVLQRWLTPVFFPKGRLSAVPGTKKTNIRRTLIGLLLALNFIPLSAIIFTHISYAYKFPGPAVTQGHIMSEFNAQIIILSMIFISLGIFLTLIVSRNLSKPLGEITKVLKTVGKGNFGDTARVTTNDEIGYIGDVVNDMNKGLKEREIIKDVFGKYVSRDVRDEILSGNIPLDGEKKTISALFCDLRNFTTMTESNDPKLIIKIMNRYFKEMDTAVQNHGGLVLQFIGDEIYAIFGAPIALENHASKAFQAALEMNRRLVSLNSEFEKTGWPLLRHGIGMHTGEALAATIGSPQRMSYSLVGDNINLASRLQSLTKEMGCSMIISEATYHQLSHRDRSVDRFNKLPPTIVKGRKKPVKIFSVLS